MLKFWRFTSTKPFYTCVKRFYAKRNYADEFPKQPQTVVQEFHKFDGIIPQSKLTISFTRAGGPGGQNVNKVNTKVDVRFHVDTADWLPDEVKERLKEICATKLNKNGELVIQSSVYRTQEQNLNDAIERLKSYVEEAYKVPKVRHCWTGRTKSGDKKRLEDKKRRSETKQRRREAKNSWFE